MRAKRQSLLSIIFDRSLLMRFVNGVALAVMDLALLFASLVIALRVKAGLTTDPTTLSGSVDYAWDVLPFAALAMLLLFLGDGLYRPRNLRPGSARIMGSLLQGHARHAGVRADRGQDVSELLHLLDHVHRRLGADRHRALDLRPRGPKRLRSVRP